MRLPGPSWQRFLLAAGGGLLLSAAYPLPCLAGAAWAAPALMLAPALGRGRGEAFRLGYVAGLAHFLSSLYWLLLIPVAWAPILGWLALSGFVALYPATWVWLSVSVPWCPARAPHWPLNRAAGLEPSPPQSGSRWARFCWPAYAAALWVAMEFLRAWFLSGFPWNPLGASQFRLLPLIQLASVTGVWGISFLVAWTSAALLLAVLTLLPAPQRRVAWLMDLALPAVVVTLAFAAGQRRLATTPATLGELRVACVQPSIPQTMIWDEAENTNRFAQLLALSRQAMEAKPDLLVWPEAALPPLDLAGYSALTNLVREGGVALLFGADDAAARRDGSGTDYFNAAVLVERDGRFADVYRKRKLVMFGEFVPLSRWLPFLKHLTPIGDGFAAGTAPAQFALGNPRARFCPLICFEDIFPGLVHSSLKPDTDLIVNLTNNGWFGESAAQWQHATAAIFRAVENGLPLLRSANNGLTCWVDTRGRLVEQFTDARGTIYGVGVFHACIPLPSPDAREMTVYRRLGDWFPWLCAGTTLAAVVIGRRRRASV